MTIHDVDIWRAAHLLLKQRGKDAAIVAAQHADELLAQGDVEGEVVSKRIVAAIGELQRDKRTDDEKLN